MQNNNIDKLKKYKNVHMIGIGGVSMSGIAAILNHFDFNITGTDKVNSPAIENLKEKGVQITIGTNTNLIKNSDLVIYTAAISSNHPEILEAKKLNIKTIERADYLGELTKCFSNSICVSGTHGKTTTTSMVSLCFIEALKDPTIQVGAHLKQLDGNYRIGDSDFFIIEACEYVESFLKFFPKAEIILNIDNDHLDYFKNFDAIKNAFIKYVKLLPKDGFLVVNGDDTNCLDLQKHTSASFVTYGIENANCNFFAQNIIFDNNGFPSFDVFLNNTFYESFKLSVRGSHNISNALSCIALCHQYNLDKTAIKNALLSFTGAHRRFEFCGLYKENISIYDDYAHHPTEILATYDAMKNIKYNSSWVIFQPHTYSRTFNLLDEFSDVLSKFDNVILLDIYSAREQNTYNISSLDLLHKMKGLNSNISYIPDFDKCLEFVKNNVSDNDIVITLGAGTVTELSKKFSN